MLTVYTQLRDMVRSSAVSLVAIIVGNLIPLFGVLYLGWDVFTLLILYWIESGVVGFVTILKISKAEGPQPTNLRVVGGRANQTAKAFVIPFFLLHYGIFWVVHGVFVIMLPFIAGSFLVMSGPTFASARVSFEAILLATVVLFLSHLAAYYFDFVKNGEYLRVSPVLQAFKPYGRVIVLHVTIILGSILVFTLGQPIALLVLLVFLKTTIEVISLAVGRILRVRPTITF